MKFDVMPETWTNDHIVREYIRREGNKEYFVDTVMANISALGDTLYLWQRQIIKTNQLSFPNDSINLSFLLYPLQSTIVNRVIEALAVRSNYYDENLGNEIFSDSEEEGERSRRILPEIMENSTFDWKKFTLVTG
jgi:hypothetical protein